MPLQTGSSKKTIQSNISELIDTYKEKGKIGNTTPKNMKHAIQIANAIAYSKAKKKKKKALHEAFEHFIDSLKTEQNKAFLENVILKGFNICFEDIDDPNNTDDNKIIIDTNKITPDELNDLQDNLNDLKAKKDEVAAEQKDIEEKTNEMTEQQNEQSTNI